MLDVKTFGICFFVIKCGYFGILFCDDYKFAYFCSGIR